MPGRRGHYYRQRCRDSRFKSVFREYEFVHVRYMLSPVRLWFVCHLSVMFVHLTQPVEIFGSVSTPFGILTSTENFTEIVPGECLRPGDK